MEYDTPFPSDEDNMLYKIDTTLIRMYQSVVDFFYINPKTAAVRCIKGVVLFEILSLALAYGVVPTPVFVFKTITAIGYVYYSYKMLMEYGPDAGMHFRVVIVAFAVLVGVAIDTNYELAGFISLVALVSAHYFTCCKTPPPRKKSASKLSFGF